MDRRNFLSGLLASVAMAPLTRCYGVEPLNHLAFIEGLLVSGAPSVAAIDSPMLFDVVLRFQDSTRAELIDIKPAPSPFIEAKWDEILCGDNIKDLL